MHPWLLSLQSHLLRPLLRQDLLVLVVRQDPAAPWRRLLLWRPSLLQDLGFPVALAVLWRRSLLLLLEPPLLLSRRLHQALLAVLVHPGLQDCRSLLGVLVGLPNQVVLEVRPRVLEGLVVQGDQGSLEVQVVPECSSCRRYDRGHSRIFHTWEKV